MLVALLSSEEGGTAAAAAAAGALWLLAGDADTAERQVGCSHSLSLYGHPPIQSPPI